MISNINSLFNVVGLSQRRKALVISNLNDLPTMRREQNDHVLRLVFPQHSWYL